MIEQLYCNICGKQGWHRHYRDKLPDSGTYWLELAKATTEPAKATPPTPKEPTP